jgi:hypothetical protein
MFGEPADAETCLSWGMAGEVIPTGQALTTSSCRPPQGPGAKSDPIESDFAHKPIY